MFGASCLIVVLDGADQLRLTRESFLKTMLIWVQDTRPFQVLMDLAGNYMLHCLTKNAS